MAAPGRPGGWRRLDAHGCVWCIAILQELVDAHRWCVEVGRSNGPQDRQAIRSAGGTDGDRGQAAEIVGTGQSDVPDPVVTATLAARV
jgi:hypothetical protein